METSKLNLKIGYFPIADHLILGVAEHNESGQYKHFELTTKQYGNWDTFSQAVTDRELDGGFFLFPIALDLYRRNVPLKLTLLGHREGQLLIARDEITSIPELVGKTIHVPHKYSTHHILLQQALNQAGVQPEDVKIRIGFKSHPKEIADTFIKGETDAFLLAEPMSTYARRNAKHNILALSHDINAHHVDCVLVLREEIIKEHPEAVQELTDSLVKAGMFINAYPRRGAEIGNKFLGWDKKLLIEALTHDRGHILYWDLLPRIEDMEEMQKIAVSKMGLWPGEVDLTDFVDGSFAQNAYREWMLDERQAVKDRGENRTLPGNTTEALSRLHKVLGDFDSVCVNFIDAKEKKPQGLKKISELPREFSEMFDNEYIVDTTKGNKVIFQKAVTNCNRVILSLSEEQATKIVRALSYGVDEYAANNYNENTVWKELVTTEAPFTSMDNGESVFLSIDNNVLRFLALAISHFR